MIEESLSGFGFGPSEITVYLHLLKRGSSYANSISSSTGINRSNVYEALDRLIEKGIVSFVSRNKAKWYKASPSESLNSLLKIKEDEFRSQKENFLESIKEIRKIAPPKNEKVDAAIFSGRDGLKMIFEEMLELEKPIAFFAAKMQFSTFFEAYYHQWHMRRAKKNIIQRTIFPEKVRHEKNKQISIKLRKVRYVDDKFTSPTTTVIYGDVVAIVMWGPEPLAVRIENKEIAKSHLNYFNMVWNS
jgi:sugar-specific transcriptional regulator TrmB